VKSARLQLQAFGRWLVAGPALAWFVMTLGCALSILLGAGVHGRLDESGRQRFEAMAAHLKFATQERLRHSRELLHGLRQGPPDRAQPHELLLADSQHGPGATEAVASLNVGVMMEGLVQDLREQIRFELLDQTSGHPGVVLAQSPPASNEEVSTGWQALLTNALTAKGDGARPRFHAEWDLPFAERTLKLRVNATPAFEAELGLTVSVWLSLLGTVFSGIAAMSIWLIQTRQARARHEVLHMTHDLQCAQREAEQALRESAVLVETLDQFTMVCITAADGAIAEVNETLCRASGYSREELIGQNPRMLGSGMHEPFYWIAVWQTLLHGQPWQGPVCNRHRDGHIYWAQCVIAPVRGATGQIEKYISMAYDITAARQLQDELKANAERYHLAIDGGNDGLWDWVDVHALQAWWSPQFYRLLGHEPGDMPSDMGVFKSLLHPDERATYAEALERALSRCEPFDIECRMRTSADTYRWFRLRAKVYFDDMGEATRMAGSMQDVHDHRLAQAQIKAHSEQIAAIFALSPDGFVSFNAQGHVSFVSPALQRLTGLADNLLGLDETAFSQRLFERAEPHQSIHCLAAVRQHMHPDGDSHAASRVVIEMKPPGRRMLEMRLSLSQGGEVSQVLHLRDVTHETEVDQMKSAFLSMAAHELRTPMASIYGFTELLLHREFTPDKQKDMLARIYRQSGAMIGIINELLDLARIEARQGKDFEFDSWNLADLVAQVIRDFKPEQDRALPVCDWPDEALMVWVDPKKSRQAVLNVLSNAFKYSPMGGDVYLRFVSRAEHGRQMVGVEIQDQGIGLTPDQLARVGERFYRADKSGNIPGTGLGVAIVKEIMEVLGGSLEMQSEYGKGSRVILWLPKVVAGGDAPVDFNGTSQEVIALN
jgi:PAS domain S-box-containing protein